MHKCSRFRIDIRQRIPLKIVLMNSELGAARRPGMMAR
jgi:hypothetical protein